MIDCPDALAPLATLSYAYDEVADEEDAERAAAAEQDLAVLVRAEAERLLADG